MRRKPATAGRRATLEGSAVNRTKGWGGGCALGALALALWLPFHGVAAGLDGIKTLTLHGRDGRTVDIGKVRFAPAADGAVSFSLDLDPTTLQDHFLSMREFKCATGDTEVLCHVPYPYKRPSTVSGSNYAWLEHALMFLYKEPRDFGAKLRNGLYFRFEATDKGLVGMPQAIDLTVVGVPPDDLSVPPYRPALRDDITPGSRWATKLTIE
jgi:hypothetical protein